MEKHTTELYCDRCKRQFQRRESGFANTLTAAIGWFFFTNGGGSKKSSQSRSWGRWENLDYDMCSNCTGEFQTWWENPPERVE